MTKIITITGTNGKTTVLKILEKLLLDLGCSVGYAGSLGVFVNREKVKGKDSSGPYSYKILHEYKENNNLDFIIVENVLRHIKNGTI